MKTFSWRHIEIFRAVMTTKNLTDAAQLVRTSQPTVSREISRLESLLRFKLFDRIKGRLLPTAQGLRLFAEVERSYYGLERIYNMAEIIRQFRDTQLSVACLPVFSQSLLPKACQRFLLDYPEVNFTITSQESPILEEWLSAQHYDIGLTEHRQIPTGTYGDILTSLNEVVVLPRMHPLSKKKYLTAKDFNNVAFISLSITDSYRQAIDTFFAEQHISRRMIMEVHNASSVCAMVREGLGISIVNPFTVIDFLQHDPDSLCIRPFIKPIPFTVNLIKPMHRPSSELTERFIQCLKITIKEFETQLLTAFNY